MCQAGKKFKNLIPPYKSTFFKLPEDGFEYHLPKIMEDYGFNFVLTHCVQVASPRNFSDVE